MTGSVSMSAVLIWTALVFVAGMTYAVVAPAVYAVYSAVRTARWFYGAFPEEVPPDKFLVKVALWRVR